MLLGGRIEPEINTHPDKIAMAPELYYIASSGTKATTRGRR